MPTDRNAQAIVVHGRVHLCPHLVEFSLEHRRAGERERHGETDVAHVEQRRMDGERRILQHRVQIAAIRGHRKDAFERIRRGDREEQKAEAHEARARP